MPNRTDARADAPPRRPARAPSCGSCCSTWAGDDTRPAGQQTVLKISRCGGILIVGLTSVIPSPRKIQASGPLPWASQASRESKGPALSAPSVTRVEGLPARDLCAQLLEPVENDLKR